MFVLLSSEDSFSLGGGGGGDDAVMNACVSAHVHVSGCLLSVFLCVLCVHRCLRVNMCVNMLSGALLAACCSAGLRGSVERLTGVLLCSAVERLTLPQHPPTLPAAWLCCHGDQI